MPDNKTWFALRIEEVYGSGYGKNVKFQNRLAEAGLDVAASNISLYLKFGFPPTTLGSGEILRSFADALDCTITDILIGHGYDVGEVDFELDNILAMQTIQMIKRIADNGDEAKLERIYKVVSVLTEY